VALRNAPEVRGDFPVDRWFRSLSVAAVMLFLAGGKVEAFEQLKAWPGENLPPFVLDDLDGRSVAFPDARGGPVLVHYFATWCIPCRRELPALAGLAVRHPAPRLTIIDVGEPDVRVKRFFAETPVPFPVLLDRQRSVAKAWRVDVLPTTILLDPALRPRLSVEGEFDWSSEDADAAVRSLMAPINSQQNQTSIQGDKP
jgi:thiol-disulfide isomerase/thioredoxin